MEELLGLSDADFEGVEDEETVEFEENRPGEPSHISRSSNPPSEPDKSTHLANAKNTVEKPSETRVLSSRPLGSSSPRVDAVASSVSPSLSNGINTSTNSVGICCEDKVDADRGNPLPEVASARDESLALLYRVERCAIEFRTAEIEESINGLSAYRDGTSAPARLSRETAEAALSACGAALRLARGEYEELLRETKLFAPSISAISVENETAPMRLRSDHSTAAAAGTARSLRSRVESFVVDSGGDEPKAGSILTARDANESKGGNPTGRGDGSDASVWRAAEAMWSGAAALGLFFQENYTGPELETSRRKGLDAWLSQKVGLEGSSAEGHGGRLRSESDVTREAANLALACDGELAYPRSSLVTSLFMAREILASVAMPSRASWRGVGGEGTAPPGSTASEPYVANGGTATVNEGGQDSSADRFRVAVETLSSASWWSGRACVTHARLLLSGDRSETLLGEARGLFRRAVKSFGGGAGEGSREVTGDAMEAVRRRVAGQVWLEWGLAQHHFQDPSKGKASFARAKEASGLTVRLTGALGKRTKHQQTQVAQLVLVASSAFVDGDPSSNGHSDQVPGAARTDPHGASGDPAPMASSEAFSDEHDGEGVGQLRPAENADGGGQPVRGERAEIARPELGMSTAIGEGETRAAARKVQHAEDSELLEDIGFVEAELQNPGKLQDVDLAIILGLCLDVSNSNPRDGLTNEEMTPYIARVLRQPGCNWMIYSTALLQRSWVEFERSHARDRAALQIQALLDQHTTKLTYTQSSSQSIENSAPVQDRVRYLSSLSFPPRWELKRDLAQRYASMGVLGSAAEAFVELEMWEEVVSCYRQMEQVHKAERIARERLKEQETPPMWAALGDLTQDPECWERAWELSGRRYARAKASLGRLRFSERDYAAACSHYEDALAVKPLLTPAWFTLGVARMRLGWWSLALEAFSRVVQQEPEEGEAWGNMGAVHMHEGNWANATACFAEGLKQMPRNWRMWENQAEALLRLGRWSSAVYACHRMLDLADKSKRGVDVNYLALLVEGTLEQEPPSKAASSTPALDASASSKSSSDDLADRPLSKQVAELLGRVVSASSADARLWEVYARFNEGAGRDRSRVLDCVSKQCRALQTPGWEKDAAVIARLASASDKLVKLHLEDGRRQSVYQAKMHLSTAVRKIKAMEVCVGSPGHERLATLLHDVEGVLAELKKN